MNEIPARISNSFGIWNAATRYNLDTRSLGFIKESQDLLVLRFADHRLDHVRHSRLPSPVTAVLLRNRVITEWKLLELLLELIQ